MKNKDFKDFDLSNFIELTEDQLRFEVNGGSKKSSSGSSSSSSSSSSSCRSNSSSSRGSSSGSSRGSSLTSTSKPSSSSAGTTTSSSSAGKNSNKQSSGRHEVANTNHAVANAKPGDTITRNDGTHVTLTKGDINYAKAHDNTPASVPTSSPAQTTTTTDGGSKTSGKSWSSGFSGSSASSSSSSYGSYVGYSGNGSGSRGSSLQATMNATRHDPDYKEAQNKGNAMPVDVLHPTGEMTDGEKQAYVHDPDFRFGKNTSENKSDTSQKKAFSKKDIEKYNKIKSELNYLHSIVDGYYATPQAKADAARHLRDEMRNLNPNKFDMDALIDADERFMNEDCRDFLNISDTGYPYTKSDMTSDWEKRDGIGASEHQHGVIGDENEKFVNKKDGREAVFTSSGILIDYGVNKGTYNYAKDSSSPINGWTSWGKHGRWDMNPYYRQYGTTPWYRALFNHCYTKNQYGTDHTKTFWDLYYDHH